MSAPLENVKVIDLSLLLPGPLCSLHLADMGAEVIKIENPRVGDGTRYSGTAFTGKDGEKMTGLFAGLNRNKKSVTLNIKREGGREILKRLVKDADILLEGFRPGTLEELGIGYTQLKEINPRLIYCAISGYGASGPRRDHAGHDANYCSIAGVLDGIGRKNEPPALANVQIADVAGGSLTALSAILAALYAREKKGTGQFLDISMTDGAFAMQHLALGELFAGGSVPERGAEFLSGALPNYTVYKTADDRFVMLAALEERFFKNFLRQVKREDIFELSTDEEKRAALVELFAAKSYHEWSALFDNSDICLTGVNTLAEAVKDGQITARQMVQTVKHSSYGEVKTVGSPFRFSDASPEVKFDPPGHGQHTRELLKQAGYTDSELEEFNAKKFISLP